MGHSIFVCLNVYFLLSGLEILGSARNPPGAATETVSVPPRLPATPTLTHQLQCNILTATPALTHQLQCNILIMQQQGFISCIFIFLTYNSNIQTDKIKTQIDFLNRKLSMVQYDL